MQLRCSAALACPLFLWVSVLVTVGCSEGVEQDVAATPQADEPAAAMPSGLRAAWIRAVQENAAPRYDWSPERAASSRAVRWQVGESELRAGSGGWEARLSTRRIGREGALATLGQASVELEGNDARLMRPGIEERWVHGPLGVEHVIEVAERPVGAGALVVELAVEGLAPELAGDAVTLSDEGGVRARYADLWVQDAGGAVVPSHLEVSGGRIQIRVEDGGARYPLVIDPLLATEQSKLVASDGAALDQLGYSVAVDGDTALVASEDDDTLHGSDAGSVYVFVRTGTAWTQQAKLEAGDGAEDDRFGGSVALDGDTAIVGAVGQDTSSDGLNAGAAYVFVRSGTEWTRQAKLVASDRAELDFFGCSVALDGDTAVVGAYGDTNSHARDAGSAYVFVRSGTVWTQQAKLEASDGEQMDFFGTSVAVNGDTVIVGAWLDETSLSISVGSAYVFVRSGTVWTQQAKLEASDGADYALFGGSVALDGDTAIVGASTDDTSRGSAAGSAYVFVRSGTVWTQQAKLEASDGAAGDWFGASVAVNGDMAMVGAVHDGTLRGDGAGSAYVFVRSGTAWTESAKLEASDGAAGDHFGQSVALDGDTAVVGANMGDSSTTSDTGSVYVFVVREAGDGADGDPCATGGECASSFCMDGVCCASACAGGAGDCQACSVAAGGTSDGTCTALSASAAPAVICRPAADACDVAETCSAGSTECPADTLATAGTECRAGSCAAGVETLPATCDGTAAGCPAEETRACGPYACASDACATSCTGDAQCASGSSCAAGTCVPELPDASVLDAGMPDAALADGGAVTIDGGCGCRAASSHTRTPWLLGLVALAVIRRRARHR